MLHNSLINLLVGTACLCLIPPIHAFRNSRSITTIPLSKLQNRCGNMEFRSLRNGQQHFYQRHLSMSLVPIGPNDLKRMTASSVTPDQWKSYWGLNNADRLQKILESFLVSYGGGWLAWFLSFMAGSFVSSIIGSLLIFNWLYAPIIFASRMNKYFWKTDKGHKTHHGFFCGTITR